MCEYYVIILFSHFCLILFNFQFMVLILPITFSFKIYIPSASLIPKKKKKNMICPFTTCFRSYLYTHIHPHSERQFSMFNKCARHLNSISLPSVSLVLEGFFILLFPNLIYQRQIKYFPFFLHNFLSYFRCFCSLIIC